MIDYTFMIKENNHHKIIRRFGLLYFIQSQRLSMFQYTYCRRGKGGQNDTPKFHHLLYQSLENSHHYEESAIYLCKSFIHNFTVWRAILQKQQQNFTAQCISFFNCESFTSIFADQIITVLQTSTRLGK